MTQEGSTAIARPQGSGLADWDGAAARGLAARREREQIIEQVLVAGTDFGVIPGTDKPTLLKPGAEKIADCLNLYPDYEVIQAREDWDGGRFFYRYRCSLKVRGSDAVVATGVGSCNSMEARYRWRTVERACPECKKPAVIKGAAKYGGGWLCWKKKGGCGKKFEEADARISGQVAGKVENDDPFSLVNTIDKMAQKRALVAASLNLGFSHKFTQDVEDGAPAEEEHPEAQAKPEPARTAPAARQDEPGSDDGPPPEEPPASGEPVISEPQRKRLYAIAKSRQGVLGWSDARLSDEMETILGRYGFSSSKEITRTKYEVIVKAVEAWA